jgi:hypothetical protein
MGWKVNTLDCLAYAILGAVYFFAVSPFVISIVCRMGSYWESMKAVVLCHAAVLGMIAVVAPVLWAIHRVGS